MMLLYPDKSKNKTIESTLREASIVMNNMSRDAAVSFTREAKNDNELEESL